MFLHHYLFPFLIFFLLLAGISSNNLNENETFFSDYNKPVENKNFLDSIKSSLLILFDSNSSNPDEIFKRVKKEKLEIKERIQKIINGKIMDEDNLEDDYELFKLYLNKMRDANDEMLRKGLADKLMEMYKNKYEGKLNKLLLQESMLCKINDSAENFDSLKNIRSKLKYGDIIEFKRFGYSHFSIYLGYNKVLQYENPMYNNITLKNILFNFPSLTLINEIDSISHGDPVRVNNKLKLNLPVNIDQINERIQWAISKNTSIKYNIFLNNCEHFSTYIRFGLSFSDQIASLLKVAKDISHPFRRIVFNVFSNHN